MATALMGLGNTLYFSAAEDAGSIFLRSFDLKTSQTKVVADHLPGVFLIDHHPSFVAGEVIVWDADQGIVGVNLASGARRTIDKPAQAGAGDVVADERGVYACGEGLDFYPVGGGKTRLLEQPCNREFGVLALSPNHLWAVTAGTNRQVLRLAKRDGRVTRARPLPPERRANESWTGVVEPISDDAAVVAFSQDQAFEVATWGQESRTLFTGHGEVNAACNVRADDHHVYVAIINSMEPWSQDFFRVDLQTAERLSLPQPEEGFETLILDGHVYVLGHVTGSIWRLDFTK
ncbi:MAG: hypothetical protein U0271_07010 [Polyangiaceae bacterium]